MRRLLVVAASSVAVLVAAAAFGGEVKGPPNTVNNTNDTAAPTHANSNCAFSGLNDFDLSDATGQLVSQVQTAADAFKFYGFSPGVQGTLGLCKGGTNADRQK